MFEYEKPNKDIDKREWLLYSHTIHKIYCFYYYLFADKNQGNFVQVSITEKSYLLRSTYKKHLTYAYSRICPTRHFYGNIKSGDLGKLAT